MRKKENLYVSAFKHGISVSREDNLITLPNQKYLERHLIYDRQNDLFYVVVNVYDISMDYCYYTDIMKIKDYNKAEICYHDTVSEIEGLEFPMISDYWEEG